MTVIIRLGRIPLAPEGVKQRWPFPVGMHLVTGGAGFIGSHLVDALVARGEAVRVLDNLSSGRLEFLEGHAKDQVEIVVCDLLDQTQVRDAMRGIEVVHHLAANPDIRLGIEVTDTDLKQGTLATYNVLEAMRMAGVSNISFSSFERGIRRGQGDADFGALWPNSTDIVVRGLEVGIRGFDHRLGGHLRREGLDTQVRQHRGPKGDPWGDL